MPARHKRRRSRRLLLRRILVLVLLGGVLFVVAAGLILLALSSEQLKRRVLVTSHDAFQYFGKAYDIDVHAVIGISTEQQARPQDVEDLKKLLKSRGVKAVFIETSVSSGLNNIVKNISDSTGVEVGGSLYSDSLGDENSPAPTYIQMQRYNTNTIVEALK